MIHHKPRISEDREAWARKQVMGGPAEVCHFVKGSICVGTAGCHSHLSKVVGKEVMKVLGTLPLPEHEHWLHKILASSLYR